MWRDIPNPNQWHVTPETARLLQHWRHHEFSGYRPFFCQVEAAETVIWLTEVAPNMGKEGRRFIDHLKSANDQSNPGLPRLALKLATGAGKTTVMAMLIAWQTVNSVRRPGSTKFTHGFLVVTPGLTIRDRLRVLKPNDPDSYYQRRELVPADMVEDLLGKAKIVITNYHAFKLRETLDLSKGGRSLLQGRGPEIRTLETEGQMLQRVMPELMAMKCEFLIRRVRRIEQQVLSDTTSSRRSKSERARAGDGRTRRQVSVAGRSRAAIGHDYGGEGHFSPQRERQQTWGASGDRESYVLHVIDHISHRRPGWNSRQQDPTPLDAALPIIGYQSSCTLGCG